MSFSQQQLADVGPLWDRMLQHRFLVETRDGTLDDATFATWMQQDYHFVEAAIPMMGVLVAKAPERHRQPLTEAIQALFSELQLFEERAARVGVDLRAEEPSFICHAYIQFLMASVYEGSYAEGFTVLYAAEKAYHESWKVVQEGLDKDSTWYPFVENWAGEDFAQYVAFLEQEFDALAEQAGADEKARMADRFEKAVRYEIAFWEMAATGGGWPGVN